ncbi:NADP-dependent oxidoreductase domain-containing protein [Aspergillus pseudoustus]|uniref:NADP-dependent oxidoreductase domain-containing protein n=1 Tax=Aspergillus pseudoustus TaxID=1810923 RepID=A0ABR4JAN5_9EURO
MANPALQTVGPIGYGLMRLTWGPNLLSQEEALKLMNTALESGSNFRNGGEFYGTPERNSLHMLFEYFSKYPENADKVFLSIKGGMKPGTLVPDCSEVGLRRSVDECIKVLQGTKSIDLFQFARVDKTISIEDSIRVLAALVNEGKIGGIGLSEVLVTKFLRGQYNLPGIQSDSSTLSIGPDGSNPDYIHDFVRGVGANWVAEQIWAFEYIDDQRRLTRRICVTEEKNHELGKLIYILSS